MFAAASAFTVLESVTAPEPPLLESWMPLVSTTGLANPIGVLIVVRFEPKLFVPPPVWLKAPVLVRGAAFPTLVVKVPELVTVVVPPTLHAPFVVKLAPVKLKLPV